jgi:hypothetical protein
MIRNPRGCFVGDRQARRLGLANVRWLIHGERPRNEEKDRVGSTAPRGPKVQAGGGGKSHVKAYSIQAPRNWAPKSLDSCSPPLRQPTRELDFIDYEVGNPRQRAVRPVRFHDVANDLALPVLDDQQDRADVADVGPTWRAVATGV